MTVRTVRADVRHRESFDATGTMDEESHASTRNCIGTPCYMPVEYATFGHVSEKTDAFAFGIVLIELITDLNGFQSRALFESDQTGLEKLAAHKGAAAHHWPMGTLKRLSELVDRCCETKANRRCTITEILPSVEVLVRDER